MRQKRGAVFYHLRRPQESPFHQLVERFYPELEAVYEVRYLERYGFWRPIIATAVAKFLECGNLKQGFARVRRPKCQHEMFVAFSCRDRCVCPSCHEKREVFALLLGAGKINDEVVANIRSWKHSGFSVDQSVRLEAGDRAGIQRLIQYFLRCPFSQARMIEVADEGKVLYKTGDNRLGRFPEAANDDLLPGPKRNFQIFYPLDLLTRRAFDQARCG